MRQNNTTLYILAGILWAIQTVFALINVFTGEVEGLGMIIGIGLAVLEGICAYALFVGDTYRFHGSIKILSIAISIAAGIVALYMLKLMSFAPGITLGIILLLGLLVAEYWALTSVAAKADENEPLDSCWYIPGALYVATVVFSYLFVKSIANKYGLSLNVAGSLISDNLVTLIFSLAVFFITGYAFYDAQKGAINNGPVPPHNTNYPMGGSGGPDSSSVFGNLYSNSFKQQNMGGTQNINNQFANNQQANMNPYNTQNNAYGNSAYTNTPNNSYGNNMNNNTSNNVNGNNSLGSSSDVSGAESDKPSGSSMFTLKKD